MKKTDVQTGATYLVKVAGNLVPVKITAEHPSGGWDGVSIKTGKAIRIKSPQRLRKRLADAGHIKAIHKADQENARLDAERAASTDGQTASERAMATDFATLDGAAFTKAINDADVATLAAALAHETGLSAKQRSRIQAALDNKRKAQAEPTPTPEPETATPSTVTVERDTGERVANDGGDGGKRMSLLDAAAHLLAQGTGDPMRCQDLVDLAVERGLWQRGTGKTPANTLYAAILREITTKGDASRFVKADRGKFARKP
ncbi:MAG: hypothetical protein GX591_19460 [Planctomycetes bacterium]|nr:hypothetical protein [Planctomycetota bacterium]